MKTSSIIFITFIFLIYLIKPSKCQYSAFGMDLDAYQERCLNEYYKIKTVIILEVTSKSNNILTQVKSPNGRIIHYNTNTTTVFSFTSQYNGYYNFCIKNNGNSNEEINIVIKSGIGANDYSSIAKSKDLEPIDYELDKILRGSQRYYKKLSHNTILYSIIMMGAMIFIGITETVYMKKYMERRKLI